ncbi:MULTISPECIES: hypothetical protein [Burkholderia]|uniref:hypothetical protein n=1 Tax=Burkholderia TaxID=32008 RepID=UPI0007591527|nr:MULTISPECIES: hypothetical protein [Burkholderia]AOJ73358.1 hypothetical protein WS78_31230 [Burkholderia savannae]KVG41192.1 hypothetical protein WS77_17380 [Burkholderia sp. MSMB0265]KVG81095.1 hypothetical protein WS81_12035 [Burkholderia sp. MSMB2040]KVG95483.1 hypothetical protein WS82_05465 [Burkholderia sp. MSMB2041]KVG96835.1 hypothetical protein WS83_01975 [Burkholderia sp. MSMB2042]
MDINAIILAAKVGRYRKDAQEDTCAVFAAALYDVLSAQGIPCGMVTAVKKEGHAWAHAVVEVAGRYFDSMGEFSSSIYRARAKIHPTVSVDITFQPDSRIECYEPEFHELHAFYVKALDKAMCGPVAARAA